MAKPKFSVCIPTYNRANSLKSAIESVLKQDFDDYEIVITDNASVDNTEEIVQSFSSPKIRYFRNKKNLGMVKNWNRVLELAKGEYVAFLFDDDEYMPNHLKEAYRILSKYDNIGIYAAGNQKQPRPVIGFIEPKDYFRYTYKMENVSPPSETIFKREFNNKQYFYNDRDYIYSPEVALYLEIANDGLKTYHSGLQTVIRNSRSSNFCRIPFSSRITLTWVFFQDEFRIIDKYKNHKYIGKDRYLEVFNSHINQAFRSYLSGKMQNIGKPDEIFQGIEDVLKEDGFYFKYYQLYLMKIISDILIKYHIINISAARKLYYLVKRKKRSLTS